MSDKALVLVVDDDPDFVTIMQFRLEQAGFNVVVAYSGKEALEKLKDGPCIALLDIQIPDMDGIEISQHVPEAVPVIFITGLVNFDRSKLPKRNNITYLIKPPKFDELIEKIKQSISTR
ncbi:MAG: response regulator [Chlamydiales bacterium]|nr:response regulator [Chlamydiales bacterium]